MAQELRVYIWCDGVKLGDGGDYVPRHDARTVEAITRVFALDGGKPRSVDLCDPCNSGPTCLTLDELRVCVKEHGRLVEAGRATPVKNPTPSGNPRQVMSAGRTRCIWCPGDYAWTAWSGHLRTAHGFAGVRDALGNICPACGEEFGGLSVHITRGHEEFPMVTDAFFWARDNGDPYKVWAKVLASGELLDAAPDDVETLL